MPRSATAKNLLGARLSHADDDDGEADDVFLDHGTGVDIEAGLFLQVPQRLAERPNYPDTPCSSTEHVDPRGDTVLRTCCFLGHLFLIHLTNR